MPRFPVLSGKRVIKTLQSLGFKIVDQEGSHIKLKKFTESRILTVIVPNHDEIARKTLTSILKQANVGLDEFKLRMK